MTAAGRHRAVRHQSYLSAVYRTAGANLVATLLGSAVGLVLARLLGATGRGSYAAVNSYLMAAVTVGELGLTAAICYFVANRPADAPDVIATGAVCMTVLGVVLGAAGWVVAPVLFAAHPETIQPFRLAFLACPVVFAGGAWTFALQSLRLGAWNAVRLAQPVFYLVAVGALAVAGRLTLLSAIAALVVSLTAQSALALTLRRTAGPPRGRWNGDLVRPLFGYGLGNVTSTAPLVVNYRLDQLVLAVVVAPSLLGQYAVAVSLSTLGLPLATAFGNVAMPRIAAGARGELQKLRAAALPRSLGVGVLSAGGICLVAPVAVPLLLGSSFHSVPFLLLLLLPGSVAMGANRVMGDLLRGSRRPLSVARCEGLGAVATVLLLGALIPLLGTSGAAIASSAAYCVTFLLLFRALESRENDLGLGSRSPQERYEESLIAFPARSDIGNGVTACVSA